VSAKICRKPEKNWEYRQSAQNYGALQGQGGGNAGGSTNIPSLTGRFFYQHCNSCNPCNREFREFRDFFAIFRICTFVHSACALDYRGVRRAFLRR
jgi:hypothetical protein